eukprot:scaffold6131_cov72-Attheya_sp.AAC.3
MRIKECGSVLKKGGRETFSGVTSCSKKGLLPHALDWLPRMLLRGDILEAEEPLAVDCEDAVSTIRGGRSLVALEGGLEVEGRSTIIRLEAAASSRSMFMDLLLDLALRVIEGGWVMGTELGLWMCFNLDVQSAEGGGLGNGGYGS